ncbi:hypothetical protein [Gelidibacter gilvus]|uniref:Toll/interleukin-1 receptor domain-containing protein n=1 Tax=Gelidibacter gilvus TaxID=59602 RepID=A0A4Q0XK86_9FLAO|nr:hypothetical protein [Gelidibacter gilvus]RXJ52632.1 hypothetical protein ESZ48_02765 [Gelidibacter gilvus]
MSSIDKTAGKQMTSSYKTKIKESLSLKFKKGEIIDGSATQNEWFPQIECDIFLSHSHKDLEKAKHFAGWVKNKFGLKVFIDSIIWGNVNDLLRDIDNEYCYDKINKTYSYEKRNVTTSHAHMMLINAISEMMDKTECLMFFETINSISIKKAIHETESPWIYSEIFLSKILRQNKDFSRRKTIHLSHSLTKAYNLNENFEINYESDTSHLKDLSSEDLKTWLELNIKEENRNSHPLDILYIIKKVT